MKKSILAVVAGVVFIIVVTTLVDIALHAAGVYPAWDKPMKHALIIGGVGVILGLVGLAATWNANLGPKWYPIALVVLAIPQCWAGGKIYEMQSAKR